LIAFRDDFSQMKAPRPTLAIAATTMKTSRPDI
jgi:hypothetical protein